MTDSQDSTVSVDGQEYKLSTLSDPAKAQIAHVRAAEAEIHRLKMLTALMETARSAYAQALKQELTKM